MSCIYFIFKIKIKSKSPTLFLKLKKFIWRKKKKHNFHWGLFGKFLYSSRTLNVTSLEINGKVGCTITQWERLAGFHPNEGWVGWLGSYFNGPIVWDKWLCWCHFDLLLCINMLSTVHGAGISRTGPTLET